MSEEAGDTRRVLVTGASRGIGRAIALRLAADGFEVTAHYRSGEAEAKALCEEIEAAGGRASRVGFDVADRAACEEALATEVKARGAFWGIVNNAGITADAAFPP